MKKNQLMNFALLIVIILSGCASAKKEYLKIEHSDSITLYESFIAKFPKSSYATWASNKLKRLYEERDWALAKKENTIKVYKNFISKYPQSYFVREAKDQIAEIEEREAWSTAKRQNSVSSYENFIRKYPRSQFLQEAQIKIESIKEERAWQIATSANTIFSYEVFIRENPGSSKAIIARKRIAELQEEADWRTVKDARRINQVENFLSKYPDSRYTFEAHRLIDEIKEENAWIEAERVNSILSYESFIRNFPNSRRRGEAEQLIKEVKIIGPEWAKTLKLNTPTGYLRFMEKFQYESPAYYLMALRKYEELEERAWNNARNRSSIGGYQTYLDQYPDGSWKVEAEKRMIDLEVDKIMKGEHGELPPMSRSGYSRLSSTNQVEIENDTKYTLTVLFSGPESRKVVINPRGTTTTTLQIGTYKIAAKVNASNVTPYAGSDNLRGGEYSSKFYIVTSTIKEPNNKWNWRY